MEWWVILHAGVLADDDGVPRALCGVVPSVAVVPMSRGGGIGSAVVDGWILKVDGAGGPC